jgi:hypothetical protein
MKPFTMLTVLFLALVAILQCLRFFFAWQATIEGTTVPVWGSGIAALVAGGLAVMLWYEAFGWHWPSWGGWSHRKAGF